MSNLDVNSNLIDSNLENIFILFIQVKCLFEQTHFLGGLCM